MSKATLRSIKNVVNGYTSAQVKVRKATSNEPHGPTQSDMEDLAELTYEHIEFLEVMEMLDKRLNDKGKNWRHVAKALTVLDYLVRCGSENAVRWSRDNLYIIKTLREFQYLDDEGHDRGDIIRVKAKELTSLLRDDERLAQERELRASRRDRRRPRHGRNEEDDDEEQEEEDELAKALRESKRTAEEEERRRNKSTEEDESLATALRLSQEEEEARRQRENQNQNIIDLSDPQQYAVQYDVWGNAVDPNALAQQQQQQAYFLQQQQLAAQQQAQQEQELLQQQYLQQQYLQQQQTAAAAQEQYLQQQYLQQQQLLAQQQQEAQYQAPYKTGSNNPFSLGNQETNSQQGSSSSQLYQQQQQPQKVQPAALTKVPTGSQQKNQQYSELNQLLSQGTGIDTFGNEGNLRIPAQFTKTGTFINSSGTGMRDNNSQQHTGNPFLNTQYTGVVSTGIVPSYTGYGFGNQNQFQQQNSRGNQQGGSNAEQSLIDI